MEDISCVMNVQNQQQGSAYKHCGKKLASNSFLYEFQGITLLWKGHLYNRNLQQKSDMIDPLCVIRYYMKNGIYKTLRRINGDFSFVLFDPRITEEESVLYVAMDIFGMFPLFTHSVGEEIYITEQETRGFPNSRFLPSCYSKYFLSHMVHSVWKLQEANTPYYIPPISMPPLGKTPISEAHHNGIKNVLLNNVQRRIGAHKITGDKSVIVMLKEEESIPLFFTVQEAIKTCGLTPLLCSKDDPILQESNEYSRIFIFSVSKKIIDKTAVGVHKKHTILYPCVDVFYLQLHVLFGFYF